MAVINYGYKAVATAGTALQVSADEAVRDYYLRADPGNTGNIAIGDSSVSMANGFVIAKTDPPFWYYGALADLWVDAATNGDKIRWFAVV